jgi:hypothetical protein
MGPESLDVVQLSYTIVSCQHPGGLIEQVDWRDLARVEIITTDAGPFAPDVFWALNGSTTGCGIPSGATGAAQMLCRPHALPGFNLPGFNNRAEIGAGPSATNRRFLAWERPASTNQPPRP